MPGPELLEVAERAGSRVRFEAAVAGGVPVVRAIEHGLAGDRLTRVAGILNGTCNYILSRMERDGVEFRQRPCRSAGAWICRGGPVAGHRGVRRAGEARHPRARGARTRTSVPARSRRGGSTRSNRWTSSTRSRSDAPSARLRGPSARDDPGTVRAAVGPALVPLGSPLASVRGSENLVMLRGQYGGETTFGGLGAGGEPTAVAVMSDLLAIAREAGPFTARAAAVARGGDLRVREPVLHPVHRRGPSGHHRDAGDGVCPRTTSTSTRSCSEPGFPEGRRPFVVSLDPAPSLGDRAGDAGNRGVRLPRGAAGRAAGAVEPGARGRNGRSEWAAGVRHAHGRAGLTCGVPRAI